MVKLIIQTPPIKPKRKHKKKHQVQEEQKVQSFDKSSRVISWVSNPSIGIQVEALMWSHQVTDLLVIFGPLSTGLVAIVR
jgi:hypothetical protein